MNFYFCIFFQGYFEVYDIDNSGNMSSYELRNALRDLGEFQTNISIIISVNSFKHDNSTNPQYVLT
jgi:Ca2+-binding EF-hand superfamily protein